MFKTSFKNSLKIQDALWNFNKNKNNYRVASLKDLLYGSKMIIFESILTILKQTLFFEASGGVVKICSHFENLA
jgi:hypothetical protein